jgi:hypothetical protein
VEFFILCTCILSTEFVFGSHLGEKYKRNLVFVPMATKRFHNMPPSTCLFQVQMEQALFPNNHLHLCCTVNSRCGYRVRRERQATGNAGGD